MKRLTRHSIGYIARAGADRVHETIGRFLSTVLFRLTAPWHNVACGSDLEIYGRPVIRSPRGHITLGNRVQLISSTWRGGASGIAGPMRLRTYTPTARIIFEDGVGMTGGSITARSKTIRIGRNTMIGPDCLIVDSDFHIAWPPDSRGTYPGDEADAPVTIGENVWFGARCIVLKGVTIGDNCVIGAGSVVVKDLPPNSLAAGNPARILKTYTAP